MIKNKIIFIILLLAIVIRFYDINQLPSLNPDEAALGYNAYSLLLTGKDEHGASWPLHFKSFGDFKPGGYVYLAMPFIKVLGLTPFAVRLPNLILSVLTILILYKLVSLLSSSKALGLYSAMVLTLSPWHIHFSRGAWESSAALFFILLGIYWFYQKKFNYFLLPFIASLYIYHSARIIAPLLVLFLFITNYQLLITNYKKLILPIIIAFFISVFTMLFFNLEINNLWRILTISFLASLMGLGIGLFIITFSTNKVEGMAMGKLSGLFILGLFVPPFVTGLLMVT